MIIEFAQAVEDLGPNGQGWMLRRVTPGTGRIVCSGRTFQEVTHG